MPTGWERIAEIQRPQVFLSYQERQRHAIL